MPFGATFCYQALSHYLQNQSHPMVGDAAGMQPAATQGNAYLALHTAAPNSTGFQDENECTYTGYSRQAVVRSSAGFNVPGAGDEATLVNDVAFGECTAGSETATHWSIGYAVSGVTTLWFWGALDTPIAIAPPVNPGVKAGSTIEFRDDVT